MGISQVQNILAVNPQKLQVSVRRRYLGRFPLSQEQKMWLLSDDTLDAQAHLTLAERAVMFHRQWPERSISPSTLSKLYKKHRVKRKTIKLVKILRSHKAALPNQQLLSLREEIETAARQRRTLIYVDECMFTT